MSAPPPDGETRGSILILGLPYFGRKLAAQLSALGWHASYLGHPGRNPLRWARVARSAIRADLLYLIGSRIDRGSPQERLLRLRRNPLVIHWVGTDVQLAIEEHRRDNLSVRIAERAVHWCDAPWLAAELRLAGISAEPVPLPIPVEEGPPPPLPAEFSVLLYCPALESERRVFDVETILALPQAFPDVAFTLVPSPPESLPAPLPANLRALPWVEDMDALYRETTVLVRLTRHDGQSFMAAEALSRGRYLIWTHPMPGASHASGLEEVTAALASLVDRHRAGKLGLNLPGRRATLDRFGAGRPLAELDERLRILQPR